MENEDMISSQLGSGKASFCADVQVTAKTDATAEKAFGLARPDRRVGIGDQEWTMLYHLIASSTVGHRVLEWIEYAALVIEILAVVIIVGAIFYAMGHYVVRTAIRPEQEALYRELKFRLGRALLLGLEILVAADIVRTVALEATLESVVVLGLLVLIRTFLSWALVVEIEGRWPWQGAVEDQAGHEQE
jgi:uncharacterized membrane protein